MAFSMRSAIKRLCPLDWIHSRRMLSNKPINKNIRFATKQEWESSRVKITLKDQKGDLLGVKRLDESKLLAQKLKLHLIEDKHDIQSPLKVFQLLSDKQLAQMDDKDGDNQSLASDDHNNDDSNHSKSAKEVKRLAFSAKLDANDLITKINAIKRWLSRGHPIAVHVANHKSEPKVLEDIYNKFENQLKGLAKFNQKKIKNNNSLKFMVLPTDETKELLKGFKSDGHMDHEMEDENLDPNTLLSDDFEQRLQQDLDKK